MAMQINGNYAQSKTDYAERVREKQAALKEASKGLPSVTSFSVEEQGEEDGERRGG